MFSPMKKRKGSLLYNIYGHIDYFWLLRESKLLHIQCAYFSRAYLLETICAPCVFLVAHHDSPFLSLFLRHYFTQTKKREGLSILH